METAIPKGTDYTQDDFDLQTTPVIEKPYMLLVNHGNPSGDPEDKTWKVSERFATASKALEEARGGTNGLP